MKFHKVYIELTNVCGLTCSFCPSKTLPSEKIALPFFEHMLKEVKHYTKEVACHVMGDPLTLSNLQSYLDLLEKHGLKAHLTTSGYYMHLHSVESLFHPAVKQLNISLNAYNKNSTSMTLETYFQPLITLAKKKVQRDVESFLNFRVWNLDTSMSEKAFNTKLFQHLSDAFNINLDIDNIYTTKPKQIRLAKKVLLHFDTYFEWPSLTNPNYGTEGRCLGLDSHIAILSNGTVVPCCLDGEGIIPLGNLHHQPLKEILQSPKAQAIRAGFKEGKAVEELCQKCSYKERFGC